MKKVAIMYDFDKTLSNKDMQEYSLIPSLGYDDPNDFWKEVTIASKKYKMDPILSYMYMVLKKSKDGLKYENLKALGKDVEFYPGVKEYFQRINEYGKQFGLEIEHYIISSGMKEMIKGTSIAHEFRKIYACNYLYDEDTKKALWPSMVVNYTTKTQFIFRINKQVLDVNDDESLNTYVKLEDRPIPFTRMIYVGDGITDVPCMKLVKEYGGKAIAIYDPNKEKSVNTSKRLIQEGRANYRAVCDYSCDSEMDKIIKMIIRNIKTYEDLKDIEGINE